MALNYTRSAFLGQSPDLLSSQVEDARRTYGNALQLIGQARGTSDPVKKAGYVNTAIEVVKQADDTFPDDIKRHPSVAPLIKTIQVYLPVEIKNVEDAAKAMETTAYMLSPGVKEGIEKSTKDIALKLRAEQSLPLGPWETTPPPENIMDTGKKFPVIPIAIAAGAIALAFMVGG